MTVRRKPWTVENTWANSVSLLLYFVGVALVLGEKPGWGLYCLGAGWLVYAFTLVTEGVNRTYPPEEEP